MGHRVIVMLSSVALLLASQVSFALGLGDITLKSSLNQPLIAEIQLLEVRDLTEREVLVGLASEQDFERIGVDRPYFLSDLRFEVNLGSPKGDVIVVTSRKPVREPFLNFIIQVRWPSGKLLREYTLLMDLPVFSDQKAAPVTSAQTSAPATPRQEQGDGSRYVPRSSFGEQSQATAESSSAPTGSVGSGQSVDVYGPVKSNDTLWEIAASVRPDRNVSIQQTMLAIQDLNPGAFINNNINLLKKGQILRIPDRDQISGLNQRQAVAEVAEQNVAWSGDTGGYDSGPQLEGRKSISERSSDTTEPEGRLKISSPEEAYDASEGRGSGAGESSSEALENELAVTLEQLDKTSKENSELRSKVESLEEQIQTMERMIEVSSEEMKALELSLQKTKEEALEADAGTLTEADASEEEMVSSEDPLDSVDSSEEVETTTEESVLGAEEEIAAETAEPVIEPTAEPTAVPTKQPQKVISRPPPEKGIVDLLLDNILFIIAGLVAVIAGVLFFIRRRAQADDDDYYEQDFLEPDAPIFDEEPPADDEPAEEPEESAFDKIEIPQEEEHEEPAFEETPTESETGDVVAEADIYIAYGKYDQAEEMLVNALNKEPNDNNARLKLLEVYANQQDVESFDPQFAKLLEADNGELADRAHQLRETIESAGEFAPILHQPTGLSAEPEEGIQDHMGGDLEFESDLGGTGEEEFSLDLDFDTDSSSAESLDFDLDDRPDEDKTVIKGLEGSDTQDESLDFDLNLDSDSSLEDELSLDLDLPEADGNSSDSSDELSLDFDLPVDEEEKGSAADSDSLEFDLDIGADSGDSDLGAGFDSSDIEGAGEEELSSLDFDLDGLDDIDIKSSDSAEDDLELDLGSDLDLGDSLESDLNELDASLGLDELAAEPDGETAETETPSLESDLDFDLDGLDDLDASMEASSDDDSVEDLLDFELPEDETAQTESAVSSDTIDDLELGDDLDLSSLDEELDALTSDMDVGDTDLASLGLEDNEAESVPKAPVMEEPVTDFDEEFDLEDGLADLEAELPEEPSVEENKAEEDDLSGIGEDTMFNKALADVPDADLELEMPEVDPDMDDDSDLGFLNDSDETQTKLDLARAYIDMGDAEGAKDILDEIRAEGNDEQRQEAEKLAEKLK